METQVTGFEKCSEEGTSADIFYCVSSLNKFSGKFSLQVKSGSVVLLLVLLLTEDSVFTCLWLEGRQRQFVGVCEPLLEPAGCWLSMFNYPMVYGKHKIVFIKKQIEFHCEHSHQFLKSQNVIN